MLLAIVKNMSSISQHSFHKNHKKMSFIKKLHDCNICSIEHYKNIISLNTRNFRVNIKNIRNNSVHVSVQNSEITNLLKLYRFEVEFYQNLIKQLENENILYRTQLKMMSSV